MIHEYNDEALRPTNKAWKCPKCGKEFFTISIILYHKEKCTNNPNIKRKKSLYDIEREKKLKESLRQFKKQYRIKGR